MTAVTQTESFNGLDGDTIKEFVIKAGANGAFRRWNQNTPIIIGTLKSIMLVLIIRLNHFVEAHSKPGQISKTEVFAKIINGFQPFSR